MKLLICIMISTVLVGCASTAPVTYPDQTPTITFRCSAECEATYTDPRDRVQAVRPTNGWDAAISITQSLMGGLPIVGMGYVAIEGFRRLDGSGAVTTTNTDASQVSNRATDNSVDYSGNQGRINSNDDYTHNPLIVTQPAPVIVTQPAPVILQPVFAP